MSPIIIAGMQGLEEESWLTEDGVPAKNNPTSQTQRLFKMEEINVLESGNPRKRRTKYFTELTFALSCTITLSLKNATRYDARPSESVKTKLDPNFHTIITYHGFYGYK